MSAATAVIEAPSNNWDEQQALTMVERAKAIVVSNVEQRTMAAEIGRVVAGLYKEAEEFFKPMKQAAAKAHKEICTKENTILEPLEQAKQYLSRQIGSFDLRMEQERRAEEARLQEEARKQAEAEAARLAQENAIADAITLEQDGDVAGALAVLAHPEPVEVYVPPVVVQREIPKTQGVSGAVDWKFKIVNEALIPREYLMVDEKKLRAIVRAMKDKTNIPGVAVYSEGAARFRA